MHNSRDFPVAFSASGIALRLVLMGLLIAAPFFLVMAAPFIAGQ